MCGLMTMINTTTQLTLELIHSALALPAFDHDEANWQFASMSRRQRIRPVNMPGQPRVAAVLMLLYPIGQEWHLLLTKRRGDLNSHAGQISFPGGRQEPAEPLEQTALREAHEEVAVLPGEVRLIGRMEALYIPPSDFQVHPFVGWSTQRPAFRPAATEVAEIIETPLSLLNNPAILATEPWQIRGQELDITFFRVGPHKVWGATAIMINEFLNRLRLAANSSM